MAQATTDQHSIGVPTIKRKERSTLVLSKDLVPRFQKSVSHSNDKTEKTRTTTEAFASTNCLTEDSGEDRHQISSSASVSEDLKSHLDWPEVEASLADSSETLQASEDPLAPTKITHFFHQYSLIK